MYKSAKDLINLVKSTNKTLPQCVYSYECVLQAIDENDMSLRTEILNFYLVMKQACVKCLNTNIPSVSGLTGGDAKRLFGYVNNPNARHLCGKEMLTTVSFALSTSEVNASMGLIAAAPTAGSSGILPSVLYGLQTRFDLSDEEIVDAMLVASGVGQIIEANATLSGAEGGCQAECGSAAAMAAAAAVYVMGGNVEQVFEAGAMALKNVLGLACDPVAGLVEVPCIKRNGSGASNALLSADLALAGIKSVIPFDEVVSAMMSIGKLMPVALRETAGGGLAVTPTGKAIARRILK